MNTEYIISKETVLTLYIQGRYLARRLYMTVARASMPPEVEDTKGVNV